QKMENSNKKRNALMVAPFLALKTAHFFSIINSRKKRNKDKLVTLPELNFIRDDFAKLIIGFHRRMGMGSDRGIDPIVVRRKKNSGINERARWRTERVQESIERRRRKKNRGAH